MKLAVMLLIYTAVMLLALLLLDGLLRRAFPHKGKQIRIAACAVCAVLLLFPPAGALVPDGPLCWFFQRWGNIFTGFMLYFFGPLLLIRLPAVPVRLAAHRLRSRKDGERPGLSRGLLVCLLLLTVIVNIFGMHAAQDVRVTRYEIPKETLSQDEPLRIVLVADLHIGVNSSPSLMRKMTERINGQDADLVVVAGDLITSSFGAVRNTDAYADALRGIRSKYGVYAVYGNHDVDEPLLGGFTFAGGRAVRNPGLVRFVSGLGWHMLEDETVRLPELSGLVIAGRRDKSRPGDGIDKRKDLAELLGGTDPSAPVLLLQHEPEDLDLLGGCGVGLSLSGHTHDGQIFPGNLITRMLSPQSYGLRQWNGAYAAVTSGVGYYGPPIRVGTISEIAVIDLV